MDIDLVLIQMRRVDAVRRVVEGYEDDSLELTVPPATMADIARVEEALGVRLPDSYRYFFMNYGPGMPLNLPVYWYSRGHRGLIEHNEGRPVPHLLHIMDTDGGDPIAFDLTRCDPAGEPVVVLADHEMSNEETQVLAANLTEFLYKFGAKD